MGIETLFNYTADVLKPTSSGPNDEENHPVPGSPDTLFENVPCAVQERSAREAAVLSQQGAVESSHRVYMIQPSGQAIDESLLLHVNELDLDLTIVGVRDGGGRGHHLEIDANEYRP